MEIKPFEKVDQIGYSLTYKYYEYSQYTAHKEEMLKNGYNEVNQMSLGENENWYKLVEYKEIPFHQRNFSHLDLDNNNEELQDIFNTMAGNPLQWVLPKLGVKARSVMGELMKYNYPVFYEACKLLITPMMESSNSYQIFGENEFDVLLSNVNEHGKLLDNGNLDKVSISNSYYLTIETDFCNDNIWGNFSINEGGY